MESCGMSCIKYLLILFNGIFLIFGVVIIAAACVDMGLMRQFSAAASGSGGDVTEAAGTETDAVLIAVGVLIIIIAGFGCFGAWRESPKLLYIFAGCLIVIILLELSVGIAAAALRPNLESGVKTQLRQAFIKHKSASEENSSYRNFWDTIQSNLKCCGVTGPTDYASDPRANPTASCCPSAAGLPEPQQQEARADCLRQGSYYEDGCEERVLSALHGAGLTVIVCGILFCFLEVAGIVLALWLAHSIKTQGKSHGVA